VLSVEKAFSQAVEMQVGHRVHRIGAEYATRFLRAHLIETYGEVLETSQLRKLAFLLLGFGALSKARQEFDAEMTSSELAARAFGIVLRYFSLRTL
jgi:hypothetical protein